MTTHLKFEDKHNVYRQDANVHPLSGGITIPQHIVIPPSHGERGPDGTIQPQRFHINSEIVIKYDKVINMGIENY